MIVRDACILFRLGIADLERVVFKGEGRDLERVMGGAVVDWLGWQRPAGR